MGKNDFSSCVIQKYPSEIEESVCFRLPRRACFGFAHLRTSLPIMTALWSESSYVFAKMKTFRMKIHCAFQVSVVIIPSTNSLAKKFDLQCCCLCSLQPRLQCGILQEFPACHERFGQQRYGLFWSWEKWMNTTLIPSKNVSFLLSMQRPGITSTECVWLPTFPSLRAARLAIWDKSLLSRR